MVGMNRGSDATRWQVAICPDCTSPPGLSLSKGPSTWLVDVHDADTTTCPRCRTRHDVADLRSVGSADDRAFAAELRSRFVAREAGHTDAALDLDPYPFLEDAIWEADGDGDRSYIVPDGAEAIAVDERLAARTPREEWYAALVDEHEGATTDDEELYAALVEDRLDAQQATTVGESLTDGAADPDWPHDPEISVVFPGEDTPLADVDLSVGPKVSEWGDDLAAQLLDRQVDVVHDAATDTFGADVDPRAPRVWGGWLVQQRGVTALDGDYARGLSRLALEDDLDEQRVPTGGGTEVVDEAAEIRELLTTLVEPGGAYGGGVDALRDGAFASLTLAETPPTVVVRFDGYAWSEADPRTGQRALDALRDLARVADVHLVINSSRLASILTAQHGLDADELTTSLDAVGGGPDEADATPSFEERAWRALDELEPWRNGYGRILVNLPDDGARYQRNLSDDPDIDLGKSAVSRYWPVLADAGLLVKETVDGRHTLRVTDLGAAATAFVDPSDGALLPPEQSSLAGAFTDPPHARVGAVCRAQQGRGGGKGLPTRSVEEWVADTPPPENSHDWVRWLWGPDTRRDRFVTHHRYAAQARGTVACVDARIREFDDPRIAYLSELEDEVLVLAQWGGPLATLARIVNALLSSKAFSKLISEERLGTEFGRLTAGDGTPLQQFDSDLWDLIVDGLQHGWFGEDEHRWDSWRDRISGVRAVCLERLADVAGTDRWDERGELMDDLHGLLASATQLYRAAGYDVVVNVRCPDTANIIADEVRHRDFLDFWGATVPKHAAYDSETGVHSHYRQTHETRIEKRQWRHELGFDAAAPESEPTVQWVLTGRTATELRRDIERAVDEEVAERVAVGDEAAPYLDVDVTNGGSMAALKAVIRRLATVKGKRLADATTAEYSRHAVDIERLARFGIAATGTGDRPTQGNPMALAEGLALIARNDGKRGWLSLGDLEQACSQMDAREFLPDVGSRAATASVQALLESDEPLTASDLQDVGGFSESTWERINYSPAAADGPGPLYIMEELGIVQRVTENGTTARLATLEPWWTATSERAEPAGETPACVFDSGTKELDVVWELVNALGIDLDYEVFVWPAELETAYQSVEIEAWRAWIWAAVASGDEYETGPPDVVSTSDVGRTRLGVAPGTAVVDDLQDELPSVPSVALDVAKVTDGGREGVQ